MRAWQLATVCAIVATCLLACFRDLAGIDPNQRHVSVADEASTELAPPLLKITKGPFSAYLLPESHIGSPLEFGPYFQSVVLPAARRSRTLVNESMDGDTFPGSPFWGKTCLDSLPEASALGSRLASRIVINHRYSQWADLRRAFSEVGEAYAVEQFGAFVRTRGLLINFMELDSRIHASLERDLAIQQSTDPNLTRREYSTAFGVSERLQQSEPHLTIESIEELDDYVWAVCRLTADQKLEAIERSIQHFDAVASASTVRKPGSRLREVEIKFAALHEQLRSTSFPGYRMAHARPSKPSSGDEPEPSSFRRGEALDKLRFGLRNERWAQRIEGHAAAGRSGLIYVLGSDHLRDVDHSASLLTLLKQRGFQLEVVH